MASTRVISVIAAVAIAGISMGTAWAGGPGGPGDDSPGPPGSYGGIFSAVGSGTFEDPADGSNMEVGYNTYGDTAADAAAKLVAQCEAEGGQNCSADMVTNDNLCIVSAMDQRTRIDVGGAGPTVEAARLDAIARAAANGTPISPTASVLISDCP